MSPKLTDIIEKNAEILRHINYAEAVKRFPPDLTFNLESVSRIYNAHDIDLARVVMEVQKSLKESSDPPDINVASGTAIFQLKTSAHASATPTLIPPPSAPRRAEQFLLLLCSPETGEAIAGDLEERFSRHAARHGLKFANVWYWGQVFRSAGHLSGAMLWRMVAVRELWRRLVG